MVISDIEMPGESGLDLLTWVSENCPGTKMLLLTAYARFDYAAYALRYQAEDYLLKPVVHEELKQRAKQCLEKIQEEEQTEEELESLRPVSYTHLDVYKRQSSPFAMRNV